MTEKLYWKEPYSKKFEGRIVKKERFENGFKIVLDRTLFYPTSGGQLCDHGFLNGIRVIDVIEEEGEIVHIIDGDIGGEEIIGEIDWERRFDNMQQHTGQHILSQAFFKVLRAETLSSSLGEEISVIEIDLNKIDWDEVEKVENLANKIVHENREVFTHILKGEEWKKFPLRKPPLKEEEIRIVEIKDFDFSACGGTHLSRTGEVGLIKIVG
jgi:alanyl-tRNA synthetase